MSTRVESSAKAPLVRHHRRWMAISGVTGLAFFLVANFTALFNGLNVVSGVIQIALNVFVLATWLRGFRASRGRERLVALMGVVAPPVLAAITLYRVIFPFLASLH